MAVVLYNDFNTRVPLNQASFHMKMATSCFFTAVLQMLSNALNAVASIFDPAIYAVYRIIDRVSDHLVPLPGLRHQAWAFRYRMTYHAKALWGHRRMFGFVFGLAFTFQFVFVTLLLAAVHS